MVRFIQLREGPILREDAVVLALNLERDGHALTVRGEALEVSQPQTLTTAQRHALSQANIRRHVIALLAYQAPEPR